MSDNFFFFGSLALLTGACLANFGYGKIRTFAVSGSTNLTLTCTDVTTTNPNWTPGQIYSSREVKCAPVDATFGASSVV